jgi:hypothetical protein
VGTDGIRLLGVFDFVGVFALGAELASAPSPLAAIAACLCSSIHRRARFLCSSADSVTEPLLLPFEGLPPPIAAEDMPTLDMDLRFFCADELDIAVYVYANKCSLTRVSLEERFV